MRNVEGTGVVTYDDDNVPSTFSTPSIVWSGKVQLRGTIFLRQRREWPDPSDFEGDQQDVAFYTLVGPWEMMPLSSDHIIELDSAGNILNYYEQVSPPKALGTTGTFWHLDLSQPLPEAP
jgi:hypothetical protein